jgi:hypothetical protein
MSRNLFWLTAWSIAVMAASASKAQELLVDLDPALELRLLTYNWDALQESLFHAKRHRIVASKGDLLLFDEPVTIRPFEDVQPFVISPVRVCRRDNSIFWHGRVREGTSSTLGGFASIHLRRWDVNPDGVASLVLPTRASSSSDCGENNWNAPVFTEPDGPSSAADRSRFSSISVNGLRVPGSGWYGIQILPYTPKYSIVIEFDEGKMLRMPFEQEDFDRLTEEQKAQLREYQELMRSLSQMVERKPVLADLE